MKNEPPETELPPAALPVPAPGPTPLADRIYVDDRDLALLTPLSRSQWRAMRYAKEGPPYRKIGRRCVYAWADVVAWIEKQPSIGAPATDAA